MFLKYLEFITIVMFVCGVFASYGTKRVVILFRKLIQLGNNCNIFSMEFKTVRFGENNSLKLVGITYFFFIFSIISAVI